MTGTARVLVVGCGGIGGILAAHLTELAGVELTVVSSNSAIAEAVNARGYRLREAGAERVVRGAVHTTPAGGPFDWILLATQPTDVMQAVAQTRDRLAPGGAFVVLQNGLCERRVEAQVGREAVLGAIVMWGASVEEPGVFRRTSGGGFAVGRLDGAADPRLERLSALLAPVGPVDVRSDLAAARWSKLAFNCAISTLGTIGGDRVGPLLRHAFVRRLGLEILTEVVAVARAEGVRPARLSGGLDLDWVALTTAEQLGLSRPTLLVKHALLLAVGARYRNLRSSMLRAMERGREPAVDFLNGEVVAAGERCGVSTIVNAAATARVHRIASGAEKSGLDALRELYRETRGSPVLRATA